MKALVFGAGKIARGFLGQLLFRANYEITFADVSGELIAQLNERGKYYVRVMGAPDACEWITGFRGVTLSDTDALSKAYTQAEIVFTAVGGKHLASLGVQIAGIWQGLVAEQQTAYKNIICCENWNHPADTLTESIRNELTEKEREVFLQYTGISEAAVMRSGIEPDEALKEIDPLGVSVSDYWELPADLDRMRGEAPVIGGVYYLHDFGDFLQRKVYTFNGSNALIAYLGSLMKYTYLADAANNPWIDELLDDFYAQLNEALCRRYGVPLTEQQAFSAKAKAKYQDRTIVDYLERHARDPIRKLSPADRLVGPARLMEEEGVVPEISALAIAAALQYRSDNAADTGAAELLQMRTDKGADAVMESVCGIKEDETLGQMVHAQTSRLKERGLIA